MNGKTASAGFGIKVCLAVLLPPTEAGRRMMHQVTSSNGAARLRRYISFRHFFVLNRRDVPVFRDANRLGWPDIAPRVRPDPL